MIDIDFKVVSEEMQKHFNDMVKGSTKLFKVKCDTEKLWDLYINSYTEEENPIYKTKREYECNTCMHFIEKYGNIISIKDGIVDTIWNFNSSFPTIKRISDTLDKYVRNCKEIENVFLISKKESMGRHHDKAYEVDEHNGTHTVFTFYHFYLETPDIATTTNIGEDLSMYKSGKDVFERALKEFTNYAVDTVLELIESNTLYRGTENRETVRIFKKLKDKYDSLTDDYSKELFIWENSVKIGYAINRIRNTAIGTLIEDISKGEDIERAVTLYESKVAPSNYKRPKAIYTQKMLEDAKKQIQELGYLESLDRRFAVLDDISINNVLYANRNVKNKLTNNTVEDIFNDMKNEVALNIKKFSNSQKIDINKFINEVLPSSSSIELLFSNSLSKNMVSLIAPNNKSSKSLFKWKNGFSWCYTGNMTDSMLKKNVEKAGGKIDGVLRFSIQWNDDPNSWNKNDEDAHCITPNGFEIYYGSKVDRKTGGNLDIDIINPQENVPAVENITFPTTDTMDSGTYRFFVNCFTSRGGRGGFRAEIEYNGEIRSYDYSANMKQSENVKVADVIFNKKTGEFSINEYIKSDISTRKVWNVNTNTFIPISVIMNSPNYWEGETNIGAKHLFIFLHDCINDEKPNSFYNEFLNDDFNNYKRVMEALGSKAHVQDSNNQLSGVGFSLTQHGNFIIRVDNKKIYNVEY